MIDISHYNKKNDKNDAPDLARTIMIALIKCSDNNLRFISKPIEMPHVGYYRYSFESGKDIILDTSEDE